MDWWTARSLTLPGIYVFNRIVLICICANRKCVCTCRKIPLPGTMKQLHRYSHKSKMLLVIFLPHSKNSDFSTHLNALTSGITQILNKRLWTRSSPPLTLAEKQNITTRNAFLESCGTYFALLNIHRCRSQDHRWILSMFRRV